ncbi:MULTISPECIES: MFS transporter [unclassified Amycolatopsis]|uniref:MFS transporter n=1 Tax=unclassified Amycolatopsis TaxID=2618356 RepID=UPI00106E00D2|nr:MULTISPECIES: MFS transporter [unclassified Amycolatopsis]
MANRESRRIAGLMLASMASQSLMVVLAPAMVRIAESFHASVGTVSQARAVAAVAAVVSSFWLSPRLSKIGVRRAIQTGGLLSLAACLVVGLSASLWIFWLAHLIVGLAVSFLLSASFSGAAAAESPVRTLGLVAAANSLAWVAINPLSGLFAQTLSWRFSFLLPAGFALTAMWCARYVPPTKTQSQSERSTVWQLLAAKPARMWILAELAAYTAWTATMTFVGPLLIQRGQLSETLAGVCLGLGASMFFIISSRVKNLLSRTSAKAAIITSSAGMSITGGALFLLPLPAALLAVLFCVMSAFCGVRTPVASFIGTQVEPTRTDAMMTARTAITQTGYLLGAALGGALLTWSGFDALGVLVMVGTITGGLVLFWKAPEPSAA